MHVAGYKDLAYLESTDGRQYINTDIVPEAPSSSQAIVDVKYEILIPGTSFVFSIDPLDNLSATFSLYSFSNRAGIQLEFGSYTRDFAYKTNTIYTAKLDLANNKFYQNDNEKNIPTLGSKDGIYKIYLFACNAKGTAKYFFKGRIYKFSYLNSISGDFIFEPKLRLSDNKPGMYDIVNNIFHTNAGKGEFRYAFWRDTANVKRVVRNNKEVVRIDRTRNGVLEKVWDKYEHIPADYTRVAYLESTGTQYIDTGIVPNSTMKIEIVASSQNAYLNNPHIFGCRHYDSETSIETGVSIHNRQIPDRYVVRVGAGEHTFYNTDVFTEKHKHTIDLTDQTYYLDGVLKYTETEEFTQGVEDLYLFGLNTNNTPAYLSSSIIYNFIVYEDNVITHNFIPLYRISDHKPGMFDTVNQVFHTNAGTGEFILPTEV